MRRSDYRSCSTTFCASTSRASARFPILERAPRISQGGRRPCCSHGAARSCDASDDGDFGRSGSTPRGGCSVMTSVRPLTVFAVLLILFGAAAPASSQPATFDCLIYPFVHVSLSSPVEGLLDQVFVD